MTILRVRRPRLRPGDRLTFLSDGVVEARGETGEQFGFDRTKQISGESAQSIVDAARTFGQDDDITVLTVRLQEAVSEDRLCTIARRLEARRPYRLRESARRYTHVRPLRRRPATLPSRPEAPASTRFCPYPYHTRESGENRGRGFRAATNGAVYRQMKAICRSRS